jgi:hypothetical protein
MTIGSHFHLTSPAVKIGQNGSDQKAVQICMFCDVRLVGSGGSVTSPNCGARTTLRRVAEVERPDRVIVGAAGCGSGGGGGGSGGGGGGGGGGGKAVACQIWERLHG